MEWAQEPLGCSSDDDDDAASAAFGGMKAHAVASIQETLASVNDEYCDVRLITQHLMQWKASEPRSYQAAKLPESTAGLLAPFLEAELVAWEPLDRASSPRLDEMPWLLRLAAFGIAPGADQEEVKAIHLKILFTP